MPTRAPAGAFSTSSLLFFVRALLPLAHGLEQVLYRTASEVNQPILRFLSPPATRALDILPSERSASTP